MPVNDSLKSLAATDQARVLRVISLLRDYGPALKMPQARHLQSKLSDLRMDGRSNSYRIIYAAVPDGKLLQSDIVQNSPQRAREA